MDHNYKNFYSQFYFKTRGFIPSKPLNQNLFPGDYFQIKNGEITVLGNLYRNAIVPPQDVDLSAVITLNPSNWNFSNGITKPYSGKASAYSDTNGQFELSKQILAFANKGSFIFKAEEPQSIKINNWNTIEQNLIIKFTTSLFSFRELHIVTEIATAASTTLAIASDTDAELELASDTENFDLVDLFGHQTTKTIQSKGIDYYHYETKRKPAFFKAKKLVIQDEKIAGFTSDFISKNDNASKWADDFFNSKLDTEIDYSHPMMMQNAKGFLLDMLPSNELNPNNALLYFKWEDTNLDDVEKLFENYGD